MKNIPPKNSLRELPDDQRDFPLGAVVSQMNVLDIPDEDFVVAEPILIKNQGESDLCSGYAVCAVSEDQEGEELLPEYQFFKTKEISGDPDEWGADLRSACKSAVQYGSIPNRNGLGQFKGISREQTLDPNTWPSYADEVAEFHKKRTYFDVLKGGQYDVFDNIRTALWKNRAKKCSIVTGAKWRTEWLDAPGGRIQKEYGTAGFGHAFKIFGQKKIGAEMYLVAQLSQGSEVGDNGLFYFPREVVNKEIGRFGVFMFYDIDREKAEKIIKKKEQSGDGFFSRVWSFLISIFQ